MTNTFRRFAMAAALNVGVALTACDTPDAPMAPDLAVTSHGNGTALGVYTQNLFHGGDTEPILTLDFNDIPAVIQEANVFWADVQNSDFPGRAVEIVEEIARHRPHVVALQEAFQLGVLDAGFTPVGGLDMLAVLEAEIAARGLPYVTEIVQSNTSVTLPLGFDPGIGGISQWLHVVDRIATLRRTDVPLEEIDQGEYQARLPLGPVTLTRGWTRLSVEHSGTIHHVVNTHLEIQALAPVQAGQAAELLGVVVEGLDGVTIIAGDLNSDAAGEPGSPKWTPTYGNLIDAGFIDLWEAAPPAGRDPVGLTCCHDKSLTGDSPFDQRIDFLLARSSAAESDKWAKARGHFRADIVGEEAGDRTAGGLWPSDHAGLVGSLKAPKGGGR